MIFFIIVKYHLALIGIFLKSFITFAPGIIMAEHSTLLPRMKPLWFFFAEIEIKTKAEHKIKKKCNKKFQYRNSQMENHHHLQTYL